jgi:hypothetical protein
MRFATNLEIVGIKVYRRLPAKKGLTKAPGAYLHEEKTVDSHPSDHNREIEDQETDSHWRKKRN